MAPDLSDYDYYLPPELIAQYPLPRRDASRLMVVDRKHRTITHHFFAELPELLGPGDFLVFNDTRVFPARLRGRKESGGRVELLLHHLPQVMDGGGEAQGRASYRGRRLKVGQRLWFGDTLEGEVTALFEGGVAEVTFRHPGQDILRVILAQGETPLPPYIRRQAEGLDESRYQTVYAVHPGAVAAPTAGLHFTPEILAALEERGIGSAALTLHVGPGTFLPVRSKDYTKHVLLPEYFRLPPETARKLNEAKARGLNLVAVGTTTVRVLEYCASPEGFTPQEGLCDLYIYPGYRFHAVDCLITNFHLPRSTLLLLVAAFAGRELILSAYQEAIKERYRFYSYGDCMLIR